VNKETYTYLLANPQEIDKEHLGDLALVLDKYPYFQSARALQLKAFKKENSFLYNDALKKTAAYTTDRDVLFSYITSTAFIQDQISQAIMAHEAQWNEIDVDHQDVSEEVSLALDREMKQELKKANAILDPHLFEKKKEAILTILENASDPSEIISREERATEKEVNTIEENAPIPFTKEDTHSFTEWLKLSQVAPIIKEEEVVEDHISEVKKASETQTKEVSMKTRKFQQIEKFIKEQPKIVPKAKNEPFPQLAIADSGSPKALMTETLAKVYLQQKKYDKAIQAYNILMLKYPEKSGFFADQIRAVKNLVKK
jgi:tetratricopeptide (TPR) repeat protein